MDIKTLKIALEHSLCKETCYEPMVDEWTKEKPSYGQCYPTVLIINDYFGGKILKAIFEDGSGHFWNLIESEEIDLTRDQFDEGEKIPKPTVHTREEIIKESKTGENNPRYLLLKKKVEEYLKNH